MHKIIILALMVIALGTAAAGAGHKYPEKWHQDKEIKVIFFADP